MKQSIIRRPFTYTYFNATFILIGINLLCFFLIYAFPSVNRFFGTYLTMRPYLVIHHKMWWQVFTYMFLHGGYSHILFNMLGLLSFGVPVERRMGSKEFLLFYLLTGTLVGVFSCFVYYFSGAAMTGLLGASGAIYAVLLAAVIFYPDSRIMLFFVIPIKGTVLVVAYTIIGILIEMGGWGGRVSHLSHLAGFLFAYLYFLIRLGINPLNSFFRNRRDL